MVRLPSSTKICLATSSREGCWPWQGRGVRNWGEFSVWVKVLEQQLQEWAQEVRGGPWLRPSLGTLMAPGGLNTTLMLIWIVAFTSGLHALGLRATGAFKLLLGVTDPHLPTKHCQQSEKK